jgi:hypothetical protein
MLPEDGWGVVGKVVDGGFPSIHIRSQNIVLSNTGSQLQIAIGDGSRGVVKQDESTLHFERKGGALKHGLDQTVGQRDKMNAARSRACCILGAHSSRNGGRE